MAQEQKLYPKGRIALDSGDLIDITNVKANNTNNAKQVHTIKQKGAGITMGTEEGSITFDMVISEDGPERDYIQMVKRGTIKQLRIKIPGATLTYNGVFRKFDMELPLDDAIKVSLEFIGALDG